MNIKRSGKTILFISSYIPLYTIFIINNIYDLVNYWHTNRRNKIFCYRNIFIYNKFQCIVAIILILVCFVSYFLLKQYLKNEQNSTRNVTIYNIKKRNDKVNEYILVYILPFIGINTSELKDCIVIVLVFIVLGYVCIKNNYIYINPLLYFMGYNIYSALSIVKVFNNDNEEQQLEDEVVLISNYKIVDLINKYQKSMVVKDNQRLTEYYMKVSKLDNGTYFLNRRDDSNN